MFQFFEGLSNVYILSTATVFLAVIIALYCANFAKEENEIISHKTTRVTLNADPNDKNFSESESEADLSKGLVSKLKSARLKEFEGSLTEDQLQEEKRVEREQLSAIFDLLKKQEAELNMKEIDESELSAQMGLYR